MYDSANQLVRENNQAGDFTHTWTYDSAGNITARTEYAYTTGELGTPTDTVTYSYGNTNWGDLLTAYDGTAFTYETTSDGNTIGNLLSDGTWTYTWQHGRQLASMYSDNGTGDDASDDVTWTYTYNADGMRTKRTNGAFVYEYVYNGSQLSRMTVSHRTSRTLNTLYFAYDASGTPMAVTYNNTVYYYVTNIQGDVIAITDGTGTQVVSYTYDAWGNILSTDGTMKDTLGTHNPLRYRSYVYDQETGLYYLQSRYYNPELGRFINADAFAATGAGLLGNNMFAYCNNSPIVYSDSTGCRLVSNLEERRRMRTDIIYDVPAYSQEDYHLCWATCQIMIESYSDGIVLTQKDAIKAIIKLAKRNRKSIFSRWNKGGWPSNTGDKHNVNNIIDLYNLLYLNGPVYAYYNQGTNSDGTKTSHLVVVTGVNIQTNTVYTNNPWYGYQGEQTFEEFLASVAWTSDDPYGMRFDSIYLAN